jgi:excisionase family DNA binding protein
MKANKVLCANSQVKRELADRAARVTDECASKASRLHLREGEWFHGTKALGQVKRREPMEDKVVMNARQAAGYLGCSESVLRLWRSRGQGPRYFRAGKLVRFRRCDLDEWIEARLCEPEEGSKGPASSAP